MKPHQERVVTERAELLDKLSKLRTFFTSNVFDELPDAECSRLKRQAAVMAEYISILDERIAAFV